MIKSIEDFLFEIGIEEKSIPGISRWWNVNRKEISIFHLDFKTHNPIIGIYAGENKIYINKKSTDLPEFKLFIAIHESFHDSHEKNGEMERCFNLTKQGNLKEFTRLYKKSEKEANDFAISSMRDLGFSEFIDSSERRLRGNEFAGPQVFSMMRRDIEKTGSESFKVLLLSQISGL